MDYEQLVAGGEIECMEDGSLVYRPLYSPVKVVKNYIEKKIEWNPHGPIIIKECKMNIGESQININPRANTCCTPSGFETREYYLTTDSNGNVIVRDQSPEMPECRNEEMIPHIQIRTSPNTLLKWAEKAIKDGVSVIREF